MTPDVFAGLWRRRSVTVGDGPPHEPADVFWIQWRDHFVDLRRPRGDAAPLSGPGAFGGRTEWREPSLTWNHELDSYAGGGSDIGTISWDGELLVEQGRAEVDGEAVVYVEVWERVTAPSPRAGRAWSPGPGALVVQVDDHRMTIVVDGAGRWFGAASARVDDHWELGMSVGDAELGRTTGTRQALAARRYFE